MYRAACPDCGNTLHVLKVDGSWQCCECETNGKPTQTLPLLMPDVEDVRNEAISHYPMSTQVNRVYQALRIEGFIDGFKSGWRSYEQNSTSTKADKLIDEGETQKSPTSYRDEFMRLDQRFTRLKEKHDKLEARLHHRHIIGKVYEVSAESINTLAGELDETKALLEKERGARVHEVEKVDRLKDRIRELENVVAYYERFDAAQAVELRTEIDSLEQAASEAQAKLREIEEALNAHAPEPDVIMRLWNILRRP